MDSKNLFFKIKKNYLEFLKSQQVQGEPFYDKIDQLKKFYIPICKYIYKNYLLKKKL